MTEVETIGNTFDIEWDLTVVPINCNNHEGVAGHACIQ